VCTVDHPQAYLDHYACLTFRLDFQAACEAADSSLTPYGLSPRYADPCPKYYVDSGSHIKLLNGSLGSSVTPDAYWKISMLLWLSSGLQHILYIDIEPWIMATVLDFTPMDSALSLDHYRVHDITSSLN
jgi:hypothetical protein